MKYTFKQMQGRLNDAGGSEWSDSKLRYYLLEILKVKKDRKRGVEAKYSAQTLGKLLFLAKVMESPIEPSIKQALKLMEEVTAEELTRIGEGTESVELGLPGIDASGMQVYHTLSGKTVPQDRHDLGRVMEASLLVDNLVESPAHEAAGNVSDSLSYGASDYVTREFARHLGSGATVPEATKKAWPVKVNFGPDLQIRYRKPLTRSQNKQLELAGELLRSILGEEK